MKALKTIKIALIIILLYGVNSCTKFGKNFAIEGKVLNPITEEPFEGIEIRIYKKTAFNDGYSVGGGSKTIATTLTDANGYFKLNAGRLSAVYVMIKNNKGNYNLGWYKKGEGLVPESNNQELPRGKTAHWDYYMVPYGGIKLKIMNNNCLGSSDHFVLYAEGTQADDSKNGKMIDEYGCYQYNPEGYTKVPMGKRYYKYEVTRNNITNTYYDTIFIGEGENKIYEINY